MKRLTRNTDTKRGLEAWNLEFNLGIVCDHLNDSGKQPFPSETDLVDGLVTLRRWATNPKQSSRASAGRLQKTLNEMLRAYVARPSVDAFKPISWVSGSIVDRLAFLDEKKALSRLTQCATCGEWMVSRSKKPSDKAQTKHAKCRAADKNALMPLYMQHKRRSETFDGTGFFKVGHCNKKTCDICRKEKARRKNNE